MQNNHSRTSRHCQVIVIKSHNQVQKPWLLQSEIKQHKNVENYLASLSVALIICATKSSGCKENNKKHTQKKFFIFSFFLCWLEREEDRKMFIAPSTEAIQLSIMTAIMPPIDLKPLQKMERRNSLCKLNFTLYFTADS